MGLWFIVFKIGFFVTDHFFGGNTAVPFDADWETRINQYCSGYEDALAEAEKFNRENGLFGTEKEFKVFFVRSKRGGALLQI